MMSAVMNERVFRIWELRQTALYRDDSSSAGLITATAVNCVSGVAECFDPLSSNRLQWSAIGRFLRERRFVAECGAR
jgi:hypothetical protein